MLPCVCVSERWFGRKDIISELSAPDWTRAFASTLQRVRLNVCRNKAQRRATLRCSFWLETRTDRLTTAWSDQQHDTACTALSVWTNSPSHFNIGLQLYSFRHSSKRHRRTRIFKRRRNYSSWDLAIFLSHNKYRSEKTYVPFVKGLGNVKIFVKLLFSFAYNDVWNQNRVVFSLLFGQISSECAGSIEASRPTDDGLLSVSNNCQSSAIRSAFYRVY